MDVIAAHLIAATLSAVAWMAESRSPVYPLMHVIMPSLGAYTAWHAAATDPAWMVAGLALMGIMFLPVFTPGRAVWTVLNPIVTLAYLAHLGWMAFAE